MSVKEKMVCCTTCVYFKNYDMSGACENCGKKRVNWVKNPDSHLYKDPQPIGAMPSYCASKRGEISG